MKLHGFLPAAALPALVFAGFGAGGAAAYFGGPGTIPDEVIKAAHCRIAAIPANLLAADALKAYETAEPPLWQDLGSLTYPISTGNSEAQSYFDQGLKLASNFNHAEARRAFQKAQRLDPNCAMCFLGEAIVLGPNINVPMDRAANPAAVAAVRKAQELAGAASQKEKDLIAAVATRYSDDAAAERPPLDAAFADATAALAAKYPNDLELALLAVEAAMDTQPWDYWEADGSKPKGRAGDALTRLEAVLARKPDHPHAIHLYIHLVEASDNPERAEPYADKLAALMPGAGHIVHMPSHIYYRIGRYADSLTANVAASKVDEAYLTQTQAVGVYPIGYYSHNIHFVLVSAQLLGDARTVDAEADKLDKWVGNDIATAIPIVQPVKAAPYFAWAQYGEPDKVLSLAEPKDAPAYVKSMWHYARGVAFAAKKDMTAARAEADAIKRIATDTDWAMLDAWAIPVRPVLEVAENVVRARVAQAEDDNNAAIELWKKAAAAEDTIPYMEPPFWYYPVRQSLGAALLKSGDAPGAIKEFDAALAKARNSAWALYGLEQAAKASGDAELQKKASEALAKSWQGDPAMLKLERL